MLDAPPMQLSTMECREIVDQVSTNAMDVRTSHIFNIFQTSKTFQVSRFLLVPACFTLAYSGVIKMRAAAWLPLSLKKE